MLKGIDVSRWQGAIDWARVAPQVDFAFVKAGGGDDVVPYIDVMAAANAIGARQAGVPFGFYWYSSGRNTVQAQAEAIALWLRRGDAATLPWAIDIEDTSRGAQGILDGLALADAVAQMTGVRPLCYTGAWYWNPRWDEARRLGAPEVVPFDLWMAAYTPEAIIPRGWSDWTIWQHTNQGALSGITGAVDLDHARARFWDSAPGEVKVAKYRITASALNLRAEPNAASSRLISPLLPQGAIVEADAPVNGWHRLKLINGQATAGGAGVVPADPYRLPAFGYISAAWTEPIEVAPPPPPPETVSSFGVGANIQGTLDMAETCYQNGCRKFLFIDNFGAASEFMDRHPDATVHARRWGFRASGDVGQMLQQLEGANDNRLIYEGPNEGDTNGQNGPDLAYRLECEVKLGEAIYAKGGKYAVGAFSNGEPDITNPANRKIIRDKLAAAYNAGRLYICMHLYSPDEAHIWKDDELKWFERRFEWWFGDDEGHCGLDPNVRKIVCSEFGIDKGSVGGALACGFTEHDMRKWTIRAIEVMLRPITATWKGTTKQYPSPILYVLLFIFGNSQRWAGYNHAQWMGMFKDIWAGSA